MDKRKSAKFRWINILRRKWLCKINLFEWRMCKTICNYWPTKRKGATTLGNNGITICF